MSTIIIEPNAWKYSQLSLAARFGGIRINGKEFFVDGASAQNDKQPKLF